MNKLSGIPTLNAGAPDLRLSGDQTQRGSYVQRRRAQMAGGGIMGSNAGSMLVAPTADGSRPGYADWWKPGSIFQKYIKDPFEMIITGKNPTQIENESQRRVDREQGIKREGPIDPTTGYPVGFDPKTMRLDDWEVIGDPQGTGPYTPWYEQMFKGSPTDPNDPLSFDVGDIFGMGKEQYGKYTIPMTIGATMGKLQQDYLDKQPPFPADKTGIKFQTAQEAMADPNLKFKPQAQYANVAEGGRIGFDAGGNYEAKIKELMDKGLSRELAEALVMSQGPTVYDVLDVDKKAQGGRIGYATGGGISEAGIDLSDFRDKIYSPEAKALAGESRYISSDPDFREVESDTLLNEADIKNLNPEGDYRFQENPWKLDGQQVGGLHTRETLDAANQMLDIQEDKKLQLEKIALKKGWSKGEFDNRLKLHVSEQGEGRTPREKMQILNQAFNQLAYELGVYSDWEGDKDPQSVDFRLQDPNYKSMYVSGNAQGGRIGYASGGSYEEALMDAWKTYQEQGGTLSLEQFAEEFMKGTTSRAQGGRIGYADAGITKLASHEANDAFLEQRYEYYLELGWSPRRAAEQAQKDLMEGNYQDLAQGGRVPAQEGGLMNLGGMEKDYRQEGGFVPLGGEEKADDVPARLSKNEFVFTADAVRNAGGGDIDAGAEVMENLMENLEAGGKVSEDSQGLEGAQAMFANTQKLKNRII